MKNIKIYKDDDFPKYLPKISNLYKDLFSGGKGFRSILVQKISFCLGLSDSIVQLLCQTIEYIHNASLLHDDLVDRSHLRRNKQPAWLKYSPEYAVLAGDYLLARVMVHLARHGNLSLIQLTSETISDLLEGEWLQDSIIKDWNVTLEQLDRIHDLKTASLFKWCLQAPFLVKNSYCSHTNVTKIATATKTVTSTKTVTADKISNTDINVDKNNKEIQVLLRELGSLLGLLFQRGDDLLDFDVRNYENKIVLGDLKSGYLNSFGTFVLSNIEQEKRKLFIKTQSITDIYDLLGKEPFEKIIAKFDKENKKIIEIYNHQLQNLSFLLNSNELSAIEELRSLPEILYWRKHK